MGKERVLNEIKEYCSKDYNIEEWLSCVEKIYDLYNGKSIGIEDKDKLIDEDLIIQTIKDIVDGLEDRLLEVGRKNLTFDLDIEKNNGIIPQISKLEFFEKHILYNLNRKIRLGWIHIVYERWRLG